VKVKRDAGSCVARSSLGQKEPLFEGHGRIVDPWRQRGHFDHFGADKNTRRRSWCFLFLIIALFQGRGELDRAICFESSSYPSMLIGWVCLNWLHGRLLRSWLFPNFNQALETPLLYSLGLSRSLLVSILAEARF
jgi:hypothetical protein